jgi:hypothetical protein
MFPLLVLVVLIFVFYMELEALEREGIQAMSESHSVQSTVSNMRFVIRTLETCWEGLVTICETVSDRLLKSALLNKFLS